MRRKPGTPQKTAGFGIRQSFQLEDNTGGSQEAAYIDVFWADPTSLTPDSYFAFGVCLNNPPTDVLYVEGKGLTMAAGKVVDLSGVADGLELDIDGDTSISAPTDDQIDIETAGVDTIRIIGAATDDIAPWRLGGTVLNLDFTGLAYDTKPECQAVGLRFSDSDTPFSNPLGTVAVSGTWAHSAGNGWAASGMSNDEWSVILIPLMRPENWELDVVLTYSPAAVAHMIRFYMGHLTPSGHMGDALDAEDTSVAANQLICVHYTNDGDDTFTARYTGAALVGTGDRTYKLRSKNACRSVWDEQDDAWHDYQGHQCTTVAYTPGYVFIAVQKIGANTLSAHYIKSLTLKYLL